MDAKNKNLLNKGLCSRKARNLYGFTLVELIVVITILVILGTIAFTSLGGYSGSARDSVRTSDLANLTKGLELFQIKTGSYPTPVNPVIYTGGVSGGSIISQGTLNGTLVGFSVSNPSDPLTKTSYVYSVLGNGSYYQIGAELENPISGVWNSPNIINQVYADGIKTPFLKGNYSSNPSLPSLVIVPGSVPTTVGSGGIFSPEVCFVTGGSSSNILSSGTGSCIKKKAMSLKNSDSALVGYWDMETTFLSGGVNYLKDLSGNGNDGVGSGGVAMGNTGGLVSKGMTFSSGQYIQVMNTGSEMVNFGKESYNYAISLILKLENYSGGTRLSPIEKASALLTSNNKYPIYLYYWNGSNAEGLRNFIGYPPNGSYIANGNSFKIYQHIFIVVDRLNNKYKYYLNGNLYKQNDISGIGDISNEEPLIIGNVDTHSANSYWYGIIDDIKIYSRVLSDSEIRQQARAIGF